AVPESKKIVLRELVGPESSHNYIGLEQWVAKPKAVVLRATLPDEHSTPLLGAEGFQVPGEGRHLDLLAFDDSQGTPNRCGAEEASVVCGRTRTCEKNIFVQSLRPGAVGRDVVIPRDRFMHIGDHYFDRETDVFGIDMDALALYRCNASLLCQAM